MGLPDEEPFNQITPGDDLPALSSVLVQLLDRIDDPKTTVDDLTQLIEQDPGLASMVLKRVNSPFYGFSREVSSIQQAVVILGFNTIRNIALSAEVYRIFQSNQEGFDYQGIWEHAVSTGLIVRHLSRSFTAVRATDAFTTGLLHEIGHILVGTRFEGIYSKIEGVDEGPETVRRNFREKFGKGFGEIGGWMAERWNFPLAIVEGIEDFEQPGEDGPLLGKLIHLGHHLASVREEDVMNFEQESSINPEVATELDLDSASLRRALSYRDETMARARVFFPENRKQAG